MKISALIEKLKSVQKSFGDLEVIYVDHDTNFSKLTHENIEICYARASQINDAEMKHDLVLYNEKSNDKLVEILYIGE